MLLLLLLAEVVEQGLQVVGGRTCPILSHDKGVDVQDMVMLVEGHWHMVKLLGVAIQGIEWGVLVIRVQVGVIKGVQD
jgi:hypothetical protein